MRRIAPIAFAAALAVVGAAFAYAGGAHGPGFRLPDASAACRVERGTLVCRSLAVRAGLSLPAHATPRAVGGHIWWDASTPVLRRWSRDGVNCRATGGAIVCTNAVGATIRVGPRQIAVAL
ncbi:MAG: hypothetical protein ACXVZL_08490 [Gaiellaceae bacterium]